MGACAWQLTAHHVLRPLPRSRLSPDLRREFLATIRSMAIGASLCGAMFALRWSLIVVAMVRTFQSRIKDALFDVTLASNCGWGAVAYVELARLVCGGFLCCVLFQPV